MHADVFFYISTIARTAQLKMSFLFVKLSFWFLRQRANVYLILNKDIFTINRTRKIATTSVDEMTFVFVFTSKRRRRKNIIEMNNVNVMAIYIIISLWILTNQCLFRWGNRWRSCFKWKSLSVDGEFPSPTFNSIWIRRPSWQSTMD